jgi:hypothetical protein
VLRMYARSSSMTAMRAVLWLAVGHAPPERLIAPVAAFARGAAQPEP